METLKSQKCVLNSVRFWDTPHLSRNPMLAQQVVELIILHLILHSSVHIYDSHIFKNFIIIIIIIILSRVYNVYSTTCPQLACYW